MAGWQLVVVVRWRQSNCVLRPVHCFEAVSVVIWARPTSEFFALVTFYNSNIGILRLYRANKKNMNKLSYITNFSSQCTTLRPSLSSSKAWSTPFRFFAYGLDCWPLWPNRNWFNVQVIMMRVISQSLNLCALFEGNGGMPMSSVVCISFGCETTVIKFFVISLKHILKRLLLKDFLQSIN